MKMLLLAVVALLFILCHPFHAHSEEPSVKVEAAWVQAVPPGAPATAAFMKVVNDSEQAVKISKGSSPAAEKVVPMITTRTEKGGKMVMGMETVEFLEIPANGSIELKPGGDHMMLMGLKEPLKVGATVKLVLEFEDGRPSIELALPIKKSAPADHSDHDHHEHHDHH